MKLVVFPTKEELEKQAKKIPQIDASAVLAMLQIMQAAEEIRCDVHQYLEASYQISETKLRVMIVLHQNTSGITPSELAKKTGVTKATISVMLRRMIRDGYVSSMINPADKREKKMVLTLEGTKLMDSILPEHYAKISHLMSRLTEEEREQLITLLKKITS